MVEPAAGEGADHRRHAVLDVQEVGLVSRIQKPLEERAIEESHVAVGAHAGGWQLVGVANEQHFLDSGLERNEEVWLSGLRGLVNNETCDLAPQLF